MEEIIFEEDVNAYDCLSGVIDMHIHIGPDAVRKRRVDALDAAKQAGAVKMQAIVLKNKQYITAPLATLTEKLVPGIRVFGGVCLDKEVGGLNPDVALLAGELGAKIIWMPTETAYNDLQKAKKPMLKRHFRKKIEGIKAVDSQGRLVSEIDDILDIIKEFKMVLATGHFSTKEILLLLARAKEKGLQKVLVNHPLTLSFGPTASIAEQKEMAEMGAMIEHTFVACMPAHDRLDPGKIKEAIQEIGAERTIISSDFGHHHNPLPVDGMRMAITTLAGLGISKRELDLMTKTNPAGLLDL